jgi:membrane protein YqaA with SNARE-associated domain
LEDLADLAELFAVVFALNVVPAFAPPTWMALSWIGLNHPESNPFLIGLVGAVAATLGRFVLAKLSRVVIRQRFMSAAMRDNIDALKGTLEQRRTLTFGVFLAYAFSPFPSNYLFIAYGLTPLPLWLVTVPFFIGRLASYTFFIYTASRLSHYLVVDGVDAESYFSAYFIVSQILLLAFVYMLTRIDWRHFLTKKRTRWL